MRAYAIVAFCLFVPASLASGQVVEITGSRALGMGGAFVAVASDSSATWWNPAGLGAGPFFDMTLAKTVLERDAQLPAARHRVSSFAFGTPPFGLSYYRFRITDIQPFDPTGQDTAGREDRRAGVPVRSLAASHLGVTLVGTLIPGVHAGTTLKYIRGTLRDGREDSLLAPAELLDRADALEEGKAENRFDLDLGVLAVAGPLRLGAQIRNVREPEFGRAAPGDSGLRLPRQVRAGAAFNPGRDTGAPLTVAVDADLRTYETPSGSRRAVAVGVEQWLFQKRLAVRGGARMNMIGERRRTATAGISVALRQGTYLEGHAVRGGSDDERGWGIATRVTF
jgi:hypothetical protein